MYKSCFGLNCSLVYYFTVNDANLLTPSTYGFDLTINKPIKKGFYKVIGFVVNNLHVVR